MWWCRSELTSSCQGEILWFLGKTLIWSQIYYRVLPKNQSIPLTRWHHDTGVCTSGKTGKGPTSPSSLPEGCQVYNLPAGEVSWPGNPSHMISVLDLFSTNTPLAIPPTHPGWRPRLEFQLLSTPWIKRKRWVLPTYWWHPLQSPTQWCYITLRRELTHRILQVRAHDDDLSQPWSSSGSGMGKVWL